MTPKAAAQIALLMRQQHGAEAEAFVERQIRYSDLQRPGGGAIWRIVLQALAKTRPRASCDGTNGTP